MLEFLSKPFNVILVIFLLGISVFLMGKIIEEFRLNHKLRIKQKSLRITSVFTRNKRQFSLLGAAALAPIIIIALLFMIDLSIEKRNPGHLYQISSATDINFLRDDFYKNTGIRSSHNSFFLNRSGNDFLMEETMDVTTSDTFTGSGSDDYSETNNQVLGVDEMDNALTDGKFIYTISEEGIIISLAYTMEEGIDVLSIAKKIDYTTDDNCGVQFRPAGMYVDDDHFVVVGQNYDQYCDEDSDKVEETFGRLYWHRPNNTEIKVYDKTDFSLENTYKINGNFIGTRKIDENLYIVTNNYIPYNEDEEVNLDEFIPYYTINGEKTTADYADIIHVEGTNPNSFTSFYAFDLNTNEADMETVLGDSGYHLYVSPNNMYLVGKLYYYTTRTSFLTQEDSTINKRETMILKMSINETDVEYSALGMVDGYTLNQFSMDEFEGNLRVATTTGSWGDSINNRVYILNEKLEIISKLENLGKTGETIKAVRFVGEYGYVVTFRQTDPFYVLDLADPQVPSKLGELEIPGFSTYLQPLGNDYMLGIGFDADSSGRTTGLKISVYDISDKAKPTVFSEAVFDYSEFGWTNSSAIYNHKDLLIDLDKGLIALPFVMDNTDEILNYNSGMLVFSFSEASGLTRTGFVSHTDNDSEQVYVYKAKFISDYFYSISNKYIKVSTISDPETILNSLLLQETE
ncbi:MAG: beta-propeller domain-containing protein [Candidatus Izimaplasma sp.]|nr:beta-propeller domain-containing protein [Candidatus Izimaplasma bacterium]